MRRQRAVAVLASPGAAAPDCSGPVEVDGGGDEDGCDGIPLVDDWAGAGTLGSASPVSDSVSGLGSVGIITEVETDAADDEVATAADGSAATDCVGVAVDNVGVGFGSVSALTTDA